MNSESCSVVSDSLRLHGLYSPWNSPGQNTGVGSLSPLQGIFPTQGLNPGLPHCSQVLYQLSHKGSPRILEWVVYPFSSRSSQPSNWTGVSCISGRFFTNWAMREALLSILPMYLYIQKWQPTPVFLPGKSHGQRRLTGYSQRDCKELDTMERVRACARTHTHTHMYTHTHTHLCIYVSIPYMPIICMYSFAI